MRKDLTDITLVVDRSGSMWATQKDAQGGINAFIKEQKNAPGEARFTLVQFDTVSEVIHNGIPIKEVPEYVLCPRGGTSLLDAVGNTINEVGERLRKTPEDQRPNLVVILIVTDGGENSSREFTFPQIKEMIDHQTSKYNWQFQFLGVDDSVFDAAKNMGIGLSKAAVYNVANPAQMYGTSSAKLSAVRGMSLAGADIGSLNSAMDFTSDERSAMSQS